MSTICTLNGARCFQARSTIPAWGISHHDVVTDSEVAIKGPVTLVLADLTIKGTVLSGGVGQGRAFYRIVAGSGGWGKVVPALSYVNDAGTRALAALQDAASACGEVVDATSVPPDLRVGPGWTRLNDTASRVLEEVAPNNWFVGEDGLTRLGVRTVKPFNSQVATTSYLDLAAGKVTIASPTIAALLPGVTVAGITAIDVEHEFDAEHGLRTTLWGAQGPGKSRRLAAIRAIVDQLDPFRKFRGLTEYRIVTQSGNRLNLQPVKVSTGMPNLKGVRVRPGLPGCDAQHALGARVLVGFADADPSRPCVLSFEDADSPGFLPTLLNLAGGGAAVGRVGDDVQISPAQMAASGAVAGGNPVTIPPGQVLHATISSGSSKVTSG